MTSAAMQLNDIGEVVAVSAALRALFRHRESMWALVECHRQGDWGDVGPDIAEANRRAIETGSDASIVSLYPLSADEAIGIVTEADRLITRVVLVNGGRQR